MDPDTIEKIWNEDPRAEVDELERADARWEFENGR